MNPAVKKLLLRSEFLSVALIIVFGVVFGIINPIFLSPRNLLDLLMVSSLTGIFACGVMIVLISGGIDLSFAWIGMFAAFSTARALSILQLGHGIVFPMIFIFFICFVIGSILGSFNGLLVSKLKVPVFIVTLASANIFMGVMFQFVGHVYIFPAEMPVAMIAFSNTRFFATPDPSGVPMGGLHIATVVAAAVFVILHFIMKYTMLGRSVYAIGGDLSSAERVGLKLTRSRLALFALAGGIAGIAGAVGVSLIQTANPFDFQGRELPVIAAVVVGGTRITGGHGSVFGVALGVILTNIISQNLVLIGVPPHFTVFTFGLLILLAVGVQAIQEKFRYK